MQHNAQWKKFHFHLINLTAHTQKSKSNYLYIYIYSKCVFTKATICSKLFAWFTSTIYMTSSNTYLNSLLNLTTIFQK